MGDSETLFPRVTVGFYCGQAESSIHGTDTFKNPSCTCPGD